MTDLLLESKESLLSRLFFLIKPIVLCRSLCCRHRCCLSSLFLGSFSNDEGDGNENATKKKNKQTIGLMTLITTF